MASSPRPPIFRFADRFFAAFLLSAALSAQIVEDEFIVEMDETPAAVSRSLSKRAPSPGKLALRRSMEDRGAAVLDTYDVLLNAYAVRSPGGRAALESLPGVRRVYPVYMVRRALDAAIPLIHAPEAWTALGGFANAGAGMKIAIVDSGIDQDHPGLRDDTLAAPQGFPRGTRDSDLAGTSSKVIVARSYSAQTPADYGGHGTAVAMAAAGKPHAAPFGQISGVAPRAFLGNYKVFPDTPNSGAPISTILRAIEDAVTDGMDVINLSLGSVPAGDPASDAMVRAVQRAADAGVVVVVAAGNDGPAPGSLSTLASGSPAAIVVGSSNNARTLGGGISVNGESYRGQPGTVVPEAPLSGALLDVTSLGNDGLACSALPAGSIAGRVALILRGTCFFEDKFENARRAGATAVVVYTDDRPAGGMDTGAASLPGMMISNEDGLRLKRILADQPGASIEIRFSGLTFPSDPTRMAGFSARGPSVADLIKPDLVAPGTSFYTAAQSLAAQGELFSKNGYRVTSGTSFSAPLVAGAAAAVKSARPKLTAAQIRSLVINTAAAYPAGLRDGGAGLLNFDAAVRATVAASPVSLHFGAGTGSVDAGHLLSLTNVGGEADSFALILDPVSGNSAPSFSESTIALNPGETKRVELRWIAAGLAPGEYSGFVTVRGTFSGIDVRVPYWHGVKDGKPVSMTILEGFSDTPRVGRTYSLYVRLGDSSASAVLDLAPEASVESGGGSVVSAASVNRIYPGMWQVTVRMGPSPGSNVFHIRAGPVERTISIGAI